MTKQEFKEWMKDKIVILDGATGSNLQKRGMPTGVCPELWITEHPDVLIGLQKEYIEAGSDIVYAPTFSGNRIKLKEYGLEDRLDEINTELVRICKEAAEGKALIAGDITMTGAQLEPVGDLKFTELVKVYEEQIAILAREGVDLLVIETMMSLQETRAAVIAAGHVAPDLPIIATLSFKETGKTLYGVSAPSAVLTLQGMGVSAVGLNCSAGPDHLTDVVRAICEVSTVPVIAKPNAGLPTLDENGQTVYDMKPEEFQKHVAHLVELGASVIGGCCGTAPEYIKLLHENRDSMKRTVPEQADANTDQLYLCNERTVFSFTDGQELELGDAIDFAENEELMEEYDTAIDLAMDLADDEMDAIVLTADGLEKEAEIVTAAIREISQMVQLPFIVSTKDAETVKAVLEQYSGILAIRLLTEEETVKNTVLSYVKQYGAKLVTIDKKIISC